MLKRNTVTVLFAICLLAAPPLLLMPTAGWAQVEEIVVTTRRRTESLQDVPIAVTAITSQDIQRSGIANLDDLAKLSPSVSFDSGYNPTDTRVNIRGLSATRGRANVAFLVDGIDVTSENVIAAGSGLLANRRLLNDVERIEIVKGSQSALYGRAAFAGAISYITKEPGDEFEGNVRVDAADYGAYDISAALGGPIVQDILGMRVNGVYWEEDGIFTNSVSGQKVGGGDGFGASLTAVLTPTESLKFKARVEYSDDHFDPQPTVRIPWDTPIQYPETTFTRYSQRDANGFLFGTNRFTGNSCVQDPANPDVDCVVNEADQSLAGGYSSLTANMPDHGLYCFDVLPDELKTAGFDERQLYLKERFPDYPTMPAHEQKEDYEEGFADNNVNWKQALSDGSDPLVPGWCQPGSYGGATGKEVRLSEDPATGVDYEGTDQETLRASLLATWDFDYGSWSINTGYTDAEGTVHQDQEYQARGRPDELLQSQGAFSTTDTEQFSSEWRFASNWDGPFQLTVGGLYWHEERESNDLNFIIDCFTTGKAAGQLQTGITGLCDGTDDNLLNRLSVSSWQDYWRQLNRDPRSADPVWIAETDHGSAYISFEWSLSEQWKLTFEDRYVDEQFDLTKPNFSSCTTLGFAIGGGFGPADIPLLDQAANPDLDLRCTADYFDRSTGPILWDDLPADIRALYEPIPEGEPNDRGAVNITCVKASGVTLPGFPLNDFGDPVDPNDPDFNSRDASYYPAAADPGGCPWGTIAGTQDSQYHVPKVTVEWTPSDDSLVYFFWAKAQKPGGLNQLSSGGAATTIDEERFDPEKMDTYEIGTKTAWEAAGYLQLNGAVFFLDYTDKQVGTQILVPDGVGGFRSNPRVINASSAEVWGAELEVVWQPSFTEGLTLSGAYTYIDSQYTDFIDETTTFIRTAQDAGGCPVIWKDQNDVTVATGTTNPNADLENPTFAPKCALDLSGNELERTPEHAFVGSVNLTRPWADAGFEWFAEFTTIYQGERFADQDNFTKYDDFWQLDAKFGLSGDSWDFLFYVDNVLDDDTLRGGGSGPNFGEAISDLGFSAGLVRTHFFAPLALPRIFGARLLYRF
jgi:outer membrane receptor protein involved in Fe transport